MRRGLLPAADRMATRVAGLSTYNSAAQDCGCTSPIQMKSQIIFLMGSFVSNQTEYKSSFLLVISLKTYVRFV